MSSVKVPLWVVEGLFCSYGSKMPARPGTLRADMKKCATCEEWIWERKDENWCDGKTYCDDCIADARKENNARTPLWRGYGDGGYIRREPSLVTAATTLREGIRAIPKGNLYEMDYRFWIGSPQEMSLRAVCRACGKVEFLEFSDKMKVLQEHQVNEKNWLGGDCCTVRLVKAYASLLRKRKCVICREDTTMARYGVPMCSPGCVEHWKFGDRGLVALKLELFQIHKDTKVMPLALPGVVENPKVVYTEEAE